jgi:alkyldihydroxyacetonephosphate synthase
MSGGRVAPSPVEIGPAGLSERLGGPRVEVPDRVIDALGADGIAVAVDEQSRSVAGRDWWPLSLAWAARGQVPAMATAVARPTDAHQVSIILRRCNEARVPVTPTAGGSGVCGGSVPLFGGLSVDLTALSGLFDVDETSLLADVGAGTFGRDLEAALGSVGTGYTFGHWPQSMDISTVGGWVACRGAGQYSTRYGKIEDLVEGLEVVLADGAIVATDGAAPRSATGPNLSQLFLGSEGTLGVITAARLRVAPSPNAQGRRAHGFDSFAEGLEACRRMLRRGATPAVLRLYDQTESKRNFDAETCVLLILDEADRVIVDSTMKVCDEECAAASTERLDDALVARWLHERNDTSALGPLWKANIVVDTIEVAGRWSVLGALAHDVVTTLHAVEGTLAASVHQSHAYPDGACLYFTFAGRAPQDGVGDDEAELAWQESYYRRSWDAATACVLGHGAAISHHHGIGLNRGRFLPDALGSGFGVLQALKDALDPAGILNPGKLGLRSPFGPTPWP